MLGGSVALVFLLTFLLFGPQFDSGPKRKGNDLRFMHCPACGLETMYNPAMQGSPCIQCKKGRFVATKTAVNDESSLSNTSRWTLLGIVLLIVVQALIYACGTNIGVPSAEEALLCKCRCPVCKRKYSYRASSSGLIMRCTRCKSEFQLPVENAEAVRTK